MYGIVEEILYTQKNSHWNIYYADWFKVTCREIFVALALMPEAATTMPWILTSLETWSDPTVRREEGRDSDWKQEISNNLNSSFKTSLSTTLFRK